MDTNNTIVTARGRGGSREVEGMGVRTVVEGDLTWSSKQTIQYADDVLQNCIPETYIILLINISAIKPIKI